MIRSRAAELKITEEQVLEIATRICGKPVSALDQLTARELGKLYEEMVTMKRPALE